MSIQDGKYYDEVLEIPAKSTTSELFSSCLQPVENAVNEIENVVVSSETDLFINRRPSETLNEDLSIFPSRKSPRRGSAWSSEPALTLNIPQLSASQGESAVQSIWCF